VDARERDRGAGEDGVDGARGPPVDGGDRLGRRGDRVVAQLGEDAEDGVELAPAVGGGAESPRFDRLADLVLEPASGLPVDRRDGLDLGLADAAIAGQG
jgi:hypothetical protein